MKIKVNKKKIACLLTAVLMTGANVNAECYLNNVYPKDFNKHCVELDDYVVEGEKCNCGCEFEETIIKELLPTHNEYGMNLVEHTCPECHKSYKTFDLVPMVEHNYRVVKDEKTMPTCTEDGLRVVDYECTVCKDHFTQNIVLNHFGHNYEYSKVVTLEEPTCTEQGLELITIKCTTCGDEINVDNELDVLEHNYNKTIELVENPNCTDNGNANIIYECIDCGHKEYEESLVLPNHEHHYVLNTEPTETEEGILSYSSLGKVEKEPTCTDKGLFSRTYVCSDCYDTYTEYYEIPTINHDYELTDTVKTDSTCTTEGKIEKTYTCSMCDDTYTEIDTLDTIKHDYELTDTVKTDSTCTTEGKIEKTYTCSMCDDTYTETSVINKESHEYTVSGSVIKEPTHTDEGEMELTFSCINCEDSYTLVIPISKISKHEYSFDNAEVIKEPTCTTKGTIRYTYVCGCDDSYYEEKAIPELGHKYVKSGELKESTCTTKGEAKLIETCSECGDKVVDIVELPLKEHNYFKEERENEDGQIEVYLVCKDCHNEVLIETKELPKAGENNRLNVDLALMASSLLAGSLFVLKKKEEKEKEKVKSR